MFGALYAAEDTPPDVLLAVAREFSPRLEVCEGREIVLDLTGLTRLFGAARTIAAELRRTAADRDLRVRVAIAGTRTAARLLVHHRAGITVVDPGHEAAALSPLPLALLAVVTPNSQLATSNSQFPTPNEFLATLRRWGLRTLGEFAALPPDEVAARLGQEGVAWQRLACGEDPRPLLPAVAEERFEQALDLEWPIDALEPLSFVLGRLMEPLSEHLERRDRGAAVMHVRLHLIKTDGVTRTIHERSLQLPTPIRDARTLRTLALLDLESHPPPAAIDRVVVAVDPTPGRVVQFSLLTRPLPSPEQLSTLLARLAALMGEGRCGSPVVVDSWQPGAFGVKPFAPVDGNAIHRDGPRRRGDAERPINPLNVLRVSASPRPVEVEVTNPAVTLRRFRFPVPARVRVDAGKPARVTTDRPGLNGGRVETCAGPWRTSGGWWGNEAGKAGEVSAGAPHVSAPPHPPYQPRSWDRDEWDVTLKDGATYRVFRERDADRWFIEGIVD
jgi:protein ImuB